MKFGSVAATSYTVDSATQITATSPPQPRSNRTIYITNGNGISEQVAAAKFTYLNP